MAKQGQDPTVAAPVSEAEHQAVARLRRAIAAARSDLAALKREAQSAGDDVAAVLEPTATLTASARALSTTIQTLECALQEFSRRGTPLYLGPPPARPGLGVPLVLLLLGSLVVGWLLFGPDRDRASRRQVYELPAAPRIIPPAAPRPLPEPPADPADLDPAPRHLSPAPTPAPAPPAPVAPPRRDADA